MKHRYSCNQDHIPQNPAYPRGVLFSCCLGMALIVTLFMQPAWCEVFVNTEQLALRLDAERRRAAQVKASETIENAADANWHDAVRPLLILHVEHDRTGYDRAHLPNAIFFEGRLTYDYDRNIGGCLPPTEKLARILADHGVGPDLDLLLYGEAAGLFPARVYAALALLGLEQNTRMLDGHKRVWLAEDRPVTANETLPTAVEPMAVPEGTGRVLRHGLPENFHNHVTLDARVPNAFTGKHTLPKSDQRGHLQDSVNLPWIPLIENMRKPLLIENAESMLAQAIETAHVSDMQESPIRVVAVDDRGNAAPMLFAIARHFGWDAYWDERGILGRLADGETVITSPTISSDATP